MSDGIRDLIVDAVKQGMEAYAGAGPGVLVSSSIADAVLAALREPATGGRCDVMPVTLTMADFDMIDDALFQRAADSPNERQEDQWLALRSKVGRLAQDLEQAQCSCAHPRRAHRSDGAGKCVICQCGGFDEIAVPVLREPGSPTPTAP